MSKITKPIHRFLLLSGLATLLLGCGNSYAENPESEDLWLSDHQAAMEKAKEKERPVLLNFTGSDWCPPCIQMERTVFQTPEFAEGVRDDWVLLELDFPRGIEQPETLQRQNQTLAEQFGIQGFPTFVLLNADGEELARHVGGKPGGPEAFLRWLEASRD